MEFKNSQEKDTFEQLERLADIKSNELKTAINIGGWDLFFNILKGISQGNGINTNDLPIGAENEIAKKYGKI